MQEIIRKLSSRKLWMAIAGVATGIAVALGANGSEIATVAGTVTTIISAVTYMAVEGRIDAERVKSVIAEVKGALGVIENGSTEG